MMTRHKTKLVHENRYVVEVEVSIIENETSWSPYLSLADVQRLDRARDALRRGDVKTASGIGRVYTLEPVAVV